ncbi:AraC family transcriptional regulator [Nocardioides acrostichi]|uniref:AraC family transcriptional regulator n=1 Tax=Nocardioides acrostichi TaxID=2784339 RepID=A0A930V0D0_9ACTN|nr:AraC family transcriptional regulator [Nocardioides acrostichi]MBF4161417.1 AraC family transcriptional regulator [Nocardioides acrostichi]
MTRNLLPQHRSVATRDRDEARDEVARRFCPHRLTLTKPDGRLDMVHNAAPIGHDVTLNYLRYGDEVRITPGTFDDFFLVQIPLAGRARVRVGERVVASDRSRASLGSPTEPVDMIWGDGCEQLLVYMRRAAVEAVAGVDSGEGPLVFDALMDLDAPALRSWLRLVRLGVDELDSGGALFRSSLAASHFEQTVISGLVAAQPHNRQRSTEAPALPGRLVRQVLDLMEAGPEREWHLADFAAETGVSARTLQAAFQRELGMPPLERLRRIRLERARADLLAADGSTSSVTDIAARWGFFHLGRFAASYRDAYQELPSQTLAS